MTNEEITFLDRYKKELREGKLYSQKEIAHLYTALAKGDEAAVNSLTEALMPRVLELAEERADRGVFIGDLIQEGSLALFLALGGANQKPADMPYDEYIDDAVSMALDAYMTESGAATEAEEKVASKLNVLVEKMEELEKDYGGAFGIEDVAEETGYSVEEIKDLFKLAGEDLGK